MIMTILSLVPFKTSLTPHIMSLYSMPQCTPRVAHHGSIGEHKPKACLKEQIQQH